MDKTEVSKAIKSSATNIWGVINQFVSIEKYFPAIEKSIGKGEGMLRTCTMINGASFNEPLLILDHQNLELKYNVRNPSPLQFSKYEATMKVTPTDNNRCEVAWNCTYQVDSSIVEETNGMLTEIFTSDIDELAALHK